MDHETETDTELARGVTLAQVRVRLEQPHELQAHLVAEERIALLNCAARTNHVSVMFNH